MFLSCRTDIQMNFQLRQQLYTLNRSLSQSVVVTDFEACKLIFDQTLPNALNIQKDWQVQLMSNTPHISQFGLLFISLVLCLPNSETTRARLFLLSARKLVKFGRCAKRWPDISNALFNKTEGQSKQLWQEIGHFYNTWPFCQKIVPFNILLLTPLT